MLFFFNDTATTEIYTLSLHDALPISVATVIACIRNRASCCVANHRTVSRRVQALHAATPDRSRPLSQYSPAGDRKSTRLNSSHANISYAVFCLKKKKNRYIIHTNLTT